MAEPIVETSSVRCHLGQTPTSAAGVATLLTKRQSSAFSTTVHKLWATSREAKGCFWPVSHQLELEKVPHKVAHEESMAEKSLLLLRLQFSLPKP